MVYEITKACEIANKPYKPGDLIDEKETSFFATVMKKVDKVMTVKADLEPKGKGKDESVPAPLTKAEMIKVIDGLTPLTDDQKKALAKLNVADLTAEMEKVKADLEPKE